MGEYSVSDRPYQPDHISLIAGRDDTEVENGPTRGIAIIDYCMTSASL